MGVTLILQELDNSTDHLHDHLQLNIHCRGPPSQCHCHYVSSVSSFETFAASSIINFKIKRNF